MVSETWASLTVQPRDTLTCETFLPVPVVALLKLESPVDTTEFPVINLNSDCNRPENCEALQLYGFGLTSNPGSPSDVLKVLESNYQWFGSGRPFIYVYADSSSGVCFGDSGGPAVIGNTQYGIASFVQGGCASGNADGYARVSTYYSWIEQQICAKSTDTANFSCTSAASWRNAIRDGASRLYFGVQGAVGGMVSLAGFGPSYSGDILVFPMGGQ